MILLAFRHGLRASELCDLQWTQVDFEAGVPFLTRVTASVPASTGPQWAYEIKHDGFRFICQREGERVRVFSRTGHEWGAQLPAIAAATAPKTDHPICRRL